MKQSLFAATLALVVSFAPWLPAQEEGQRSRDPAKPGMGPEQKRRSRGWPTDPFTLPPDPEDVPDMILRLRDPEPKVRVGAAWALGELGPKARDAVPDLLEALKDRSIANLAQYALARIGKPAIPALVKLMKDEDNAMRDPADLHSQLCSHAFYALREMGPEAKAVIPDLIELIKVPKFGRAGFIEFLGDFGSDAKDAIPLLSDILLEGRLEPTGRDNFERWKAATTLGQIGRLGVPALLRALRESDDQGRYWAAVGLCEAGPEAEAAIPALLELRTDRDIRVREMAGSALEAVGKAAVPALIRGLRHDDLYVRGEAVRLLGRLGPDARDAAPHLKRLLDDEDPFIGKAAAAALSKVSPKK